MYEGLERSRCCFVLREMVARLGSGRGGQEGGGGGVCVMGRGLLCAGFWYCAVLIKD